MPDIEAEASPQEYARLATLAFIREQPTLFSLLDH
jgi:hypothetical protein